MTTLSIEKYVSRKLDMKEVIQEFSALKTRQIKIVQKIKYFVVNFLL